MLLEAPGAPWAAHGQDYAARGAALVRNAVRPPNELVAIPRRDLGADPQRFGAVPTYWLGWLACRDVGVALGRESLADAAWASVKAGEVSYQCLPIAAEFPPGDPFRVNLLVPRQGKAEFIRTPGNFALATGRSQPGRADLTVVERSPDTYEVVANLQFTFSRDDKLVQVSVPLAIGLLEPERPAPAQVP